MPRLCTRFMLGIALVGVVVAPAAAQSTSDADEHAVIEAVQAQLRYLGHRDVDALADTFIDDAIIIVSRMRDGAFANSVTPVADWLARMDPEAATFEEPISNIHVTVDSEHLAHLRADFEIVQDGEVRSSGADQFTLVREADGWKVAVIAYTSIPADR